VPQQQPKRGRPWLNDGACIRLRPEWPGQVWAYDFVEDRTRDGRRFRMLCVVDEFSREALAIRVARQLSSAAVIDTLADLFIARGAPGHIRSDQGPEFVAEAVKGWIEGVGPRRPASRRRARGKAARSNPATASCAMSCCTGRCSTAFGRPRP
jgi:transposase InsO family protein